MFIHKRRKMKKKLCLAFIILLTMRYQTVAQRNFLAYLFSPDTTVVTRTFPSVGLDSRLSIFGSEAVSFKGVRAGIRFGKNRNRLTVSYRWFSFQDNVGLVNYKDLARPLNRRYFAEFDGYFYALSYQHIFVDSYRFALGATTDIAIGAGRDDALSFAENINIFNRTDKFVPVQLGVYTEFKATRFAGVYTQAGYRWAGNYKMQPSISKLYLGIGARLYFGSLYRHFEKR